jgi:hypothetical protein
MTKAEAVMNKLSEAMSTAPIKLNKLPSESIVPTVAEGDLLGIAKRQLADLKTLDLH